MNGTLVIEEQRSVVDNFRKFYKEKLIDTGMAQKFEESLQFSAKCQKWMVEIGGIGLSIAALVCPADGFAGEIISVLGTGVLTKLTEMKTNIENATILTAKRNFEANFIKADGSSEKVEIPDVKIVDVAKEAIDFAEELSNVGGKSL